MIFVYGLLNRTGSELINPLNPVLLATTVATAFLVGYLPNVALRRVLRSTSLRDFKREDHGVYKSFRAVPVEVIDGIDTTIRDRLSDFHITAVQNLATANPLMLFVETPYGIYQMLDWVAQAQLCCSVGPTTLLRLWSLGIRTIFDLERVALDPACNNPQLLKTVGSVLLATAKGENKSDPEPTVEMIRANIRLRLNDSHVHRLRQLFNRIDEKLGLEAKRLPPILECSPGWNIPCPFSQKVSRS